MTKQWRPDKKSWIKIKREHCKVITSGGADCGHCPAEPMKCNKSFEAGADAILKELKKGGTYVSRDETLCDIGKRVIIFPYKAKGWLVFIEETE